MTDTTLTPDTDLFRELYREVNVELGTARALLEIVAENLAPSPGGEFRVRLSSGTAARISEVVAGFRTHAAMTSDQSQAIEGGIAARMDEGLF